MSQTPGGHAGGRWRAATLVAFLGVPSLAIAAAPSKTGSIHTRFAEGQQHFQQKRYLEAATVFAALLGEVEEELLNRVTRESLMRNTLVAYEWAYRSSTDDDGRKDVALLDEGQRVLDEYRRTLTQSYGADAVPSTEMVELITRFEEARRIAHEAHDPKTSEEPSPGDDGPDVGPCLSVVHPPPASQAKGCGGGDGNGGGDGSIAWLGVLALPLVRRRQALERCADRLPPDVVQRMRARDDEDG